MPYKTFYIHFVILLILPIITSGQNVNLKKEQDHIMVVKLLDSTAANLQEKGMTNIVTFCSFGFAKKYGCIVWKDDCHIKGRKIYFKRGKITFKKISSSHINKSIFENYFDDQCDLKNTFQNGKSSYISHDFMLYLSTIDGKNVQKLFFPYSRYLGNKDTPCAIILKELMRLAE